VESPSGKRQWSLPVSLNLGDSGNDWRKITMMKGWWMAQVWQNLSDLCGLPGLQHHRVVWLDADARLNGPLDIELEPEAEVVAAPWCHSDWEKPEYAHILSGLLLLQGGKHGKVSTIIERWSSSCLGRIQNLPPAFVPWLDGDQEVLTEVLQSLPETNGDYVLLKLEEDNYGSCPMIQRKFARKSLVDHWDMSTKMKKPPERRDPNWPPPEEYRRSAAIGTPLPNNCLSDNLVDQVKAEKQEFRDEDGRTLES
jgi:hypothetical protein